MEKCMEKLKKDLIKLLSENARYSFSQLSSITGEKEDKVKSVIEEMEKDGIIVKYSAIINDELLNDKVVQAFIEVKVAPQKLKGFDSYAEEIYTFPEVRSLYLMSGGFDLAVFVEGENLAEISRFISEKLSVLDGITSVQTHFILKKYKIEGSVTKKDREVERQIYQA